ncbi:LuxR C-terminal-related transcriptional regulator [Streptomyces lavendulae]|uniref:LuxR C-terminal-related transcriptional regulator n=1 Tax=Streptomyces lavendulae TaxID=1914 RepID=UPI0036E3574F
MPFIEGTVIRLTVVKLPSGVVNGAVWLWWSRTSARHEQVDRCRQAFLRRLDVEQASGLLKQTLGWTRPKLWDSAAADRWPWLVLAAHAQLRLARILPRPPPVLALVGRGLSNDEIASTLSLSPLTAKTHVNRILAKLPPATAPNSSSPPTKAASSAPATTHPERAGRGSS